MIGLHACRPFFPVVIGILAMLPGWNPGVGAACVFPTRWEGSWFQSGVLQPILIQGDTISTKGRCVEADGDKTIVHDLRDNCFRCVVIHEKHPNVLQYKETYCDARDSVARLCGRISGDAQLFSLFRRDANPVACPLPVPALFSYSRGHGECKSPASTIEQCSQPWRLLLRYQACPDVHGTESSVEELVCLATWKEGSARYLVGQLYHKHALSEEDRYRCFLVERWAPNGVQDGGIHVAQSGDATCNGLFSATEGSRTMALRPGPVTQQCRFPGWLTTHPKWYSLDSKFTVTVSHEWNASPMTAWGSGISMSGHSNNASSSSSASYGASGADRFLHNSPWTSLLLSNASSGGTGSGLSSFTVTNHANEGESRETRLACSELRERRTATGWEAEIVVQYTAGCQGGFVCLLAFHRDQHILELQMGNPARRLEDACHSAHFNRHTAPYYTLVSSNPPSKPCPFAGKYVTSLTDPKKMDPSFPGSSNPASAAAAGLMMTTGMELLQGCSTLPERATLASGCSLSDTLVFRSTCAGIDNGVAVYSCHGGWQGDTKGQRFLIATPVRRSSRGARRVCFAVEDRSSGTTAGDESPGNELKWTVSGEACPRDNQGNSLAFNALSIGSCTETSAAEGIKKRSWTPVVLVLYYWLLR